MFKDTKSVFTIYNNSFDHRFNQAELIEKAKMMDIDDEMLAHLKSADFEGFIRLGCAYADAVVKAEDEVSESLNAILNDIPEHKLGGTEDDEDFANRYYNLYTQLAG